MFVSTGKVEDRERTRTGKQQGQEKMRTRKERWQGKCEDNVRTRTEKEWWQEDRGQENNNVREIMMKGKEKWGKNEERKEWSEGKNEDNKELGRELDDRKMTMIKKKKYKHLFYINYWF